MLSDPGCSSEQGKKKPAVGIVEKLRQTLFPLSGSQGASQSVCRPSVQKSSWGVGGMEGDTDDMTHSNSPKLIVSEKRSKGIELSVNHVIQPQSYAGTFAERKCD